jgi:AraC-like DNA-binding protein
MSIASLSLHSRDPEETCERLSLVAPDIALRSRDSGPFATLATAFALPGMGFFSIALANGQVVSPEGRGYYSLSVPREESLEIRDGGAPAVFSPGRIHLLKTYRPFDLRTAAPGQTLVVNIEAALLEPHLRTVNGTGSASALPPFRSALDLEGDGGAALGRTLLLVWSELQADDSPFLSPFVSAEAAQLIAGLLARAVVEGGDESRNREAGPAALRRAAEYLTAHLSAPVSLADVALVAGMSVRSLERAFRRQYGMGAIAFLRSRRFEAARRALAAASSEGQTVTEIALFYGFSHLGRFSTDYRRRFGESPSHTLARSRAVF